MRKLFVASSFLYVFFTGTTYAQNSLSYFIPGNNRYDKSIPTPEEVLGYQT
jgi:hypothetical protein